MPVGDAFTQREVDELTHAALDAEERSGLRFSVFVGPADGAPEHFAERLLASLADASRSVLIHVDPEAGDVEIVAGHEAATRLDDRACGLAAESMTPSLNGGDIVGGVVTGLRLLGDAVFWGAAAR